LRTDNAYEWQRLYEAAILETDRSRLPELIAAAQAAIDERSEKLQLVREGKASGSTAGDGIADEKQAIEDALGGLRILSKEIY